MPYERPNIARMTGYAPGEQPQERTQRLVKLNTNENPYPPAKPILQALREVTGEDLRRYPPPDARALRETLAEAHGVQPDNVLPTNGGDELLRLAVTTFVEPSSPIGMAQPSYSLYPVLAQIHASPVARVALNRDWSLPDDFAQRLNDAGASLTFVVNPHAPSGRLTDADRLAEIARRLRGVLVIDEAYADFVDPDQGYDAVPLISRLDNVLILRSMSKGYSLAGLRLGYALGPRSLIQPMRTKTKDSYNTDVVAQRLATAAIAHRDQAARSWEAVREQRMRLTRELELLGLSVAPSQSNFLLVSVPSDAGEGVGEKGRGEEGGGEGGKKGGEAKQVYEALKSKRIFVRYFDQDRLRDKLRITVGAPQDNDALLRALREVLR